MKSMDLFKIAEREANAAMMKELSGSMEQAFPGIDPNSFDPEVANAINTIMTKLQKQHQSEKHVVEKASALKIAEEDLDDTSLLTSLSEAKDNIVNYINNYNKEPFKSESASMRDASSPIYREQLLGALSDNPSLYDSPENIIDGVNKHYINPSYSQSGLNDPKPLFTAKEKRLAKTLEDAYASTVPPKSPRSGGIFENVLKSIDNFRTGVPQESLDNVRATAENLLERNRQRRRDYLTNPPVNQIVGGKFNHGS